MEQPPHRTTCFRSPRRNTPCGWDVTTTSRSAAWQAISYVEFDGSAIDPDRLREAATKLATRHPMLRVQFLSDGTQRIDPAAERTGFPVTVHDLRDLAEDVVEQRLTVLREAKSHQHLDGQVLELTLSLLPGGRSRLHVDLDMQAADAMSYRTLMADLAALYRGGSCRRCATPTANTARR